ncbi:unannotated protein [freshwater metagenome]|uniref:Unannotated protein n=1 Tax=freshwater metagenome TaxID=449393 RepID=A0A6J7RMT2_9ZZZZ
MTAEDRQDAEVEERACNTNNLTFVELARPSGPAKLVIFIAPEHAGHEDGNC